MNDTNNASDGKRIIQSKESPMAPTTTTTTSNENDIVMSGVEVVEGVTPTISTLPHQRHPPPPPFYRDFATTLPSTPAEEAFDPLWVLQGSLPSTSLSSSSSTNSSRHNFPVQLHILLNTVETVEGLASIVSWKPHGRCFVIHRLQEFERYVLPRYVVESTWVVCGWFIRVAFAFLLVLYLLA